MKSGNILIEHVDTGCWLVPDEQLGNAYNISHVTAIEVNHSDDAIKGSDYYLVAYIHRGREIELYRGTEQRCIRMSNKILDSIMVGLSVIRVWKLAAEIESEDDSGSPQAIIDTTR